MYPDLREVFWWNGMKKDIADFVAKNPKFQQVKVEHQKPGGMTQAINIPTWKWEVINMEYSCVQNHTQVHVVTKVVHRLFQVRLSNPKDFK